MILSEFLAVLDSRGRSVADLRPAFGAMIIYDETPIAIIDTVQYKPYRAPLSSLLLFAP